jgi:hypothetical protein
MPPKAFAWPREAPHAVPTSINLGQPEFFTPRFFPLKSLTGLNRAKRRSQQRPPCRSLTARGQGRRELCVVRPSRAGRRGDGARERWMIPIADSSGHPPGPKPAVFGGLIIVPGPDVMRVGLAAVGPGDHLPSHPARDQGRPSPPSSGPDGQACRDPPLGRCKRHGGHARRSESSRRPGLPPVQVTRWTRPRRRRRALPAMGSRSPRFLGGSGSAAGNRGRRTHQRSLRPGPILSTPIRPPCRRLVHAPIDSRTPLSGGDTRSGFRGLDSLRLMIARASC